MTNHYRFPIPLFNVGAEPHVCLRGGFTPEECDKIIDLCELIAHEQNGFTAGRVGGNDGGEVRPEARITDVVWLHPTHENDWVHRRMAELVARVNHEKFQLDLVHFDSFQFSQYLPGGHYDWHIDVIEKAADPLGYRKLSISLMLTDPEEYEGGTLLLNSGGDQAHTVKYRPMKGDIVLFYSHVPHKVEPVITGKRLSLVTWAMGEKVR